MVVASKTTVNVSVILAGVALTSTIVYYIGSELFGSQSATSIFSDAVDRIRSHEELVSVLGEPVKGHGEPSRNSRRRNRRITSQVVEDHNNEPHLFMRFYVEGPDNQGTVMLEMIKVILLIMYVCGKLTIRLYYRMKKRNGSTNSSMWMYQAKAYLPSEFI